MVMLQLLSDRNDKKKHFPFKDPTTFLFFGSSFYPEK